jgi:ASC-1-like (ASCH) protein
VAHTHIAIIRSQYVVHLRTGVKRIEARFSRTRRAPFGRVARGDRIVFKCSGRGVLGSARVRRVRYFERLTPRLIAAIRARYERQICGGRDFWRVRRFARFGVLIWIGRLSRRRPTMQVPRQFGTAWLTLDVPEFRVADVPGA